MNARALYAGFALVGLATALYFGGSYWTSAGASPSAFSALAFANGPAATLSADLTVVYLLANVWVVREGRRLGMRHLWLYVLANTVLAVAVGLPLFLLVREGRLGRAGPATA